MRRICVVTDSRPRGRRISTVLEQDNAVGVVLLDATPAIAIEAEVIVVAAGLRNADTVAALRHMLANARGTLSKIFILDGPQNQLLVQASALGATDTLIAPFTAAGLRAKLPRPEKTGSCARSMSLTNCAEAMSAIFTEMSVGGRQLNLGLANDATHHIVNHVSTYGLTAWLDDVRRHHEGTFQHCLLVAGIAVDFGISLGFADTDLHNLGLAATLHDLGKAAISRGILDKPGKLDPRERRIIESHPVIGHEWIKSLDGLSPGVLDAVLHHHEYLDGSGYPHGLKADAIPDLTRMITISDIFAALIERRSYAPPMDRPAAWSILIGMTGKLEKALVAAFEPVALLR